MSPSLSSVELIVGDIVRGDFALGDFLQGDILDGEIAATWYKGGTAFF